MTRTKFWKFKKADAYFQLFFLSFVLLLITIDFGFGKHYFISGYLMYAYFSVGAVQLLSYFLNWYYAGNNQSRARKIYSVMLGIIPLLFIPYFMMYGLYYLLLVSPLMACFYVGLNYAEMKNQAFFL